MHVGEETSGQHGVNTYWPGNNDVRCRDGNYNAPNWFGLADCTDPNWWNDRCNIYLLKFDWDRGRRVTGSDWRWYRYIGCHEWGHTSSVGHRNVDHGKNNSCMKDGKGRKWLDPHDHAAINRDYP